MVGSGTYTSSDGKMYTGEYVGGMMHGKGELTLGPNSVYVGLFEGGAPSMYFSRLFFPAKIL